MNDLEKQHKKGNYKNCTEQFWDLYKATIVLPIRVSKKDLKNEDAIKYDIMGFLCIDSLDAKAFPANGVGKLIVNYLRPIVDNYYTIMDEFDNYLNPKPSAEHETVLITETA